MDIIVKLKFSLLVLFIVTACGGSTGSGGSGGSTGSATLNWTPPTQYTDETDLGDDLAGYIIYYGSFQNQLVNTISIDTPGVTSYVVSDLPANTLYFFAVTAVTVTNTESGFSNIASKQL